MLSDERIRVQRDKWDARCHFCGGPSFPWLTDDETWAEVEPLLGQHQACFECFMAARFALGLNDGEPMHIRRHLQATGDNERERLLMEVSLTIGTGLPNWNSGTGDFKTGFECAVEEMLGRVELMRYGSFTQNEDGILAPPERDAAKVKGQH